MSDVIRTEHLTKRFGGKRAVDLLDLSVPAGAIFALLGGNGAGKSTTIRMLTGLLPADCGRAEVLGQNAWSDAIALRHRVGYVPERPKFYDWMSVHEIGWFTAGFHRLGYLARYTDLIKRCGLDGKTKLSALSKGGYAKVGLALALAVDPELLILDEPTSGLDLFVRREFLASMVEMAGSGRTIFISSHQVAELERVASHVAFLADGRLLLTGTLDEIRRRFVRLQIRMEGAAPELARLGTVLEQSRSGHVLQAVLQDSDCNAVEALRHRDDIAEVEQSSLGLEEIYTALLARFHHGAPNGVARPALMNTAEQRAELSAVAESGRPAAEGGRT